MSKYDVFVYSPTKDPNLSMTRTPAETAAVADRIGSFGEIEKTYTPEQARCEAERCLNCPTHWCQKNCPIGMDVPGFIARAREDDIAGAYEIIRAYSPLPEFCSRVCPQYKQCQSECTRSIRGEAVAIGRLERYVVEQYHLREETPSVQPPTADAKRVAVIGSGPSGLAAASELAEQGFSVTVYERRAQFGGLLQYGIPGMKLDKGVVADVIDRLERRGVRFIADAELGKTIVAQDLEQFDAIVLCTGAGKARPLTVENADQADGIYNAVDYLTSCYEAVSETGSADSAQISAKGKNVVVLGGGDTGNDCIGAALRQGCADLVQVELMPKDPVAPIQISYTPPAHQDVPINTSQEEAAALLGRDPHIYQATVQALETDEDGRLRSVTLIRMEPVRQRGSRRFTMQPVPGSEERIPCEMLINATGFVGTDPAAAQCLGVGLTERGNIDATTEGYATNVPGVFACGDCRSGQSLVVKAMREGRDCARAVTEYLR